MNKPGECIRVRGAREHNLYNLDLDLPRNGMTVITGPSGCGKSSLAFDTIFAEGQRRYLETLQVNARAFCEQLQRPDVDLVDGLPLTLAVEQHAGSAWPRSTLATLTEIHDHLRLLFARLGTPHCYQCGLAIRKHSQAEVVRDILSQPESTKVLILAPLVRSKKGDHKEVFQTIRKSGFLRARVNNVLTEVRDNPPLNPRQAHTIELVVDRLVIHAGIQARLAESIAAANKFGEGTIIVTSIDDGDWHDQLFNTRFACANCQVSFADLEPRHFSFYNPDGACPVCNGLGTVLDPDSELIDADGSNSQAKTGNPLQENAKFLDDVEIQLKFGDDLPCPQCRGARLQQDARSVRFADKTLAQITAMAVDEAIPFFESIQARNQLEVERGKADSVKGRILSLVVSEILSRLAFLEEVGLGYLTLDRPAPSLSGGEAQRARIATQLGGGLLGVCYILDEPTVGLHPRDTQRLISALRGLQQRGNTVLIVEHDEEVIRSADFVVDMGPGAGIEGGRIVAQGNLAEVLQNPDSSTARYLRDPMLLGRRFSSALDGQTILAKPKIQIQGARHHNLKGIDVVFPLGTLICVTGVSGSGKSSLVADILMPAVKRHLGLRAPRPGNHDRVDGLQQIDKIIEVDQSPLGRSSRSSAATYTGLFDDIRKIFATTREAKIRGFTASRFSFNAKGGRCEECAGHGVKRVAMNFLPDLAVPCPVCQGKRFSRATLQIRYRDLSIADVLDLPVRTALDFFVNFPNVNRPLQALLDVGLGYLTLGQPSSNLSGGEAQRVKLAAELARTTTGKSLIILDEPTTGLHFADVENLIGVLRRLVESGNTLVIIEHNLDLVAAADWIIDLGPEGGAAGGNLVKAGTPAEVAVCADSITGRFLRSKVGRA